MKIEWKTLIKGHEGLWREAYAQIEKDLQKVNFWKRKFHLARWRGIPSSLHREINEISAYLRVPREVVVVAQVVYDEGWAEDLAVPGHGCTSVSDDTGFGRNLDYAYPSNAAKFVYEHAAVVDGKPVRLQMFAGLLGWLAFAGPTAAAALNQPPALRKIDRTKPPTLWWFREQCRWLEATDIVLPEEGSAKGQGVAADCLLHFRKGTERFLAEVHQKTIAWRKATGRVAQTNTFQILNLNAPAYWEDESQSRIDRALAAESIPDALAKTANSYTVGTILL
jgi:diadenosine tetraphosphatase ApaH/serine/threonine PP2A family protein phosphatase